jgi:hypothetical protein
MPALRNANYTLNGYGLTVTNANGANQYLTANHGTGNVATGYLVDRSPVNVALDQSTVPTISGTTSTAVYKYTTVSSHGLNVGDVVYINGVLASGDTVTDMSGTKIVASVPSSTTFTVGASASYATGTASYNGMIAPTATNVTSSANGTYVTYTSTLPHGFVVGQTVSVTAGTASVTAAALNLNNQVIVAVPTSTTFVIANSVAAQTGTGHTVVANAYVTTADIPVTIAGTVSQSLGATSATVTTSGKIVYTTTNTNFAVGQIVNVSGFSSTAFNVTNAVITDFTSGTSFSVVNTTSASGTSATTGGTAYVLPTAATLPAFTATSTQRIDVIALDLTTLLVATPSATNGLKGTEVALTATPVVPSNWDAARYVPLATVQSACYTSTTPVSQTPVDVRNVTEYIPNRAYNRSQAVRIGGKKVGPTGDAFINVEDPAARKEFSYHSAIGAIYATGEPTLSTGDYVIHTGCQATGVGAAVVTFTGGEIYNRVTNTYIALPGGAATGNQGTTGAAGNSRIDLYVADKVTGAITVINGSTAASASAVANFSTQGTCGLPQIPSNKIGLCYALVNGTGPAVNAIRDIRPRQ